MIFKSDKFKAQWDTWAYFNDGTYYLYYLVTEDSPGEGFGVAVSKDGVHWDDCGWAVRASDKMRRYLGSGAVWKSADFEENGRFICNYSEYREDGTGKITQNIYFAWSTDLVNWTKYGDDHVFLINEDYYERYGRWDNVFPIPRKNGGYDGVWVGTPKGQDDLEGGIAFGYSEDGLKWHAVAPAQVIPEAKEAGGLWPFDGRYFGMFGSPQNGIAAYVADKINGPYKPQYKNSILFAPKHSYFPRYLEKTDEILVVHHAMSGRGHQGKQSRAVTYVAPHKKTELDEEGILRLKYWKGNEALKGKSVDLDHSALDFSKGLIVEAGMETPCNISFYADDIKYDLCIDKEGRASIERFAASDSSGEKIMSVDREKSFGERVDIRLFLRLGMLEFYLNDEFMECCVLECPEAQTIRMEENLKGAKAWEMSL
jgi:hypothetical protein